MGLITFSIQGRFNNESNAQQKLKVNQAISLVSAALKYISLDTLNFGKYSFLVSQITPLKKFVSSGKCYVFTKKF